MEPMEFLSSPEADHGQGPGVFQTVRVETEALPPIVELGRKLLVKAQEGDAEAVRDLMKQGAPFTTDWLGTSALHFACQSNHVEVVDLLLKAGISKDARNKVDRTPLHVTAQEGHVQILKLLLEYGVDVDSTDMLRMTSLHWAAENGHEECVRLLLEHGADPVAVNKFDKTPDQISFDNDRLDICHIIQEYAENPLRHVHRKEAKEKQKRAAAAHKAALEMEKASKNVMNRFIVNGEKVVKTQGQEIKEVRILKLPKKKIQPKVIFENELNMTNGFQTLDKQFPQPHPVPLLPKPQQPPQDNRVINSTEKTLQMLQAHGITMLPADESTIVASAVQSGQKVMLTEAGKMALNLTEKPITLKPPTQIPVKGMLKLPPGLLKGKKVITIAADQLINMKNQQRVIIQTDRKLKPAVLESVQKQNLMFGKQKVEVLVKKNVTNETQMMPSMMASMVDRSSELSTSSLGLDRLLTDTLDAEVQPVSQETPTGKEDELQRIKSEMEEMKRQIKLLQEQYLKKDKEAEDYKREAQEYKKLVDILQSQ